MPPGGQIKDIDPRGYAGDRGLLGRLIEAWDAKYSENPVFSPEDE